MTTFADSIIFLAAAVLFLGGVAVLGLGAWVWARAQADVFRARAHRISAETQEETIEAARDALDEIHDKRHREGYREPTDDELRQFARDSVANERVVSSMTTDQGEEEGGIPGDQMWISEERA